MSDAVFSPCGTYRYTLHRDIPLGFLATPEEQARAVNFIMLNPSTATDTVDDQTIRKCMGYARYWGYGVLWVTNLFAYRATDPRVMREASDPVGPDNAAHIARVAGLSALVVLAWGNHGALHYRDVRVREIVAGTGKQPHCLAVSKLGQPCHPLYLPGDLVPLPYARPAALVAPEFGMAP